jgi:hypothetical protein
MAVTTNTSNTPNTQTGQTQTSEIPGTGTTIPDEQVLRDELTEASQHFFSTLFRVGVRLTLAPVYLLPSEPRRHFVGAGREFTLGLTSLAHELVDTVDKLVEEVESDLTRDV